MNKILLVDDNEDLLVIMKEFLEIHGFNIIGCCVNGLDAVKLFNQNPSSVVLMDLNMPQYSGDYAINDIRKINPNAKILVLTGSADEEYIKKIMNHYNVEILRKPYPVERLIEKLNLIMDIV